MGNDQSMMTSNWQLPTAVDVMKYGGSAASKKLYGNCPQTVQQAELEAELTRKAILQVQKRVLEEYPYLSSVEESMVVCDNRLPDCPIVYVNNEFEKLTLYPKEEILGRNCRFLQGRYTNRDTVKKIRHAVDNGLPLDIELFNYRKDGTGFFNNFLMLPVHKAKGSPEVTHFIAIQKDISLVKKGNNARLWTPPECAMWFDYLNMSKYSDLLITNDIDGSTLLTLNDDDLQSLGVDDVNDREMLVKFISRLQRRPDLAYQMLAVVENKDTSSTSDSTYDGAAEEVCVSAPQNQKIWRTRDEQDQNPKDDKTVAVKCYYKDQIAIFRGDGMKWTQINKHIEKTWHVPMKIKCSIMEEGVHKTVSIKDAAQWKKVVKKSGGHVRLQLTKRLREIPESLEKAFDMLTVAVLVVDWEGSILSANSATKSVLAKGRKHLLQQPVSQLLPEVKLAPTNAKWLTTQASVVGSMKAVAYSIAMMDSSTFVLQVVPK